MFCWDSRWCPVLKVINDNCDIVDWQPTKLASQYAAKSNFLSSSVKEGPKMRQLIAFLLVLLVSVAGAMGKAPKKAEAQEGVVITPTSINRLAAVDTRVSVEDNNDVAAISTPDGDHLAMIMEVTRPCIPDLDPCKIVCDISGYCYVPKVTERVLHVYNTTTDTDTLIYSKTYPSGVPQPSAVAFVALEPDSPPLVAVLVDYPAMIVFYNLDGTEDYQTQLPVTFPYPYELDAYLDIDVAYLGVYRDPVIVVAGGVEYERLEGGEWETSYKGVVVGVVRDPDAGDFVATQSEILDCDGIVTDIDSEGDDDGNITTALICENEVSDEEVEVAVQLTSGMRVNLFSSQSTQYHTYRPKSYNSTAGAVSLSSAISISGVAEETSIAYMYNTVTPAGDVRPVLTLSEEGQPVEIRLFEDTPLGVNVIGTDIAARSVLKFKPGKALADSMAAGYIEDNGVINGFFAYLGYDAFRHAVMSEAIQWVPGVQFAAIAAKAPGQVKKLARMGIDITVVGKTASGATVTAGTLSSLPIDGSGLDIVNIEFTILGLDYDDEDDQGED